MQPIKSTRFMYIILRVNIKHDENGSDWLKDNLEGNQITVYQRGGLLCIIVARIVHCAW
jgi:hypothetical protein